MTEKAEDLDTKKFVNGSLEQADMEDQPWFFERLDDGRELDIGLLNTSKRKMSKSMAAGKIKRPALINQRDDRDEDIAELVTDGP